MKRLLTPIALFVTASTLVVSRLDEACAQHPTSAWPETEPQVQVRAAADAAEASPATGTPAGAEPRADVERAGRIAELHQPEGVSAEPPAPSPRERLLTSLEDAERVSARGGPRESWSDRAEAALAEIERYYADRATKQMQARGAADEDVESHDEAAGATTKPGEPARSRGDARAHEPPRAEARPSTEVLRVEVWPSRTNAEADVPVIELRRTSDGTWERVIVNRASQAPSTLQRGEPSAREISDVEPRREP